MSDDAENGRRLPLLYIAAPLFSSAEQQFNRDLATRLREKFRVFLPQRDGCLLTDLVRGGMATAAAGRTVFAADMEAIRACTVLVAVLDGRSIDEGVAFELGVAYSLSKTCVGLQTDVRRLLPTGNNPMIDCALVAVLPTVDSLTKWLEAFVENKMPQTEPDG